MFSKINNLLQRDKPCGAKLRKITQLKDNLARKKLCIRKLYLIV